MAAPTLNLLPLRVKSSNRSLIVTAKQVDADIREIGKAQIVTTSLQEIFEWTGVKVGTFLNFLKLPSEQADGGIRAIDDEWAEDISKVIELNEKDGFGMPPGLQGFEASEAYQHAVDVELSMSVDGKLSIGLFCLEELMDLERGEEVVKEMIRELEEFIKEGE